MSSPPPSCGPYGYLKQWVVGDTTLSGEPYALVSFEQFDATFDSTGLPWAEALAAMRVVGSEVEVTLLEGEPWTLVGMFGWRCEERLLPTGEGELQAVGIGGVSYTLTVEYFYIDCGTVGAVTGFDSAILALDLGMVEGGGGYAHLGFSSWYPSDLVYAEVGEVVYGSGNPVASEPPAEGPEALAVEAVYPNPSRGPATVSLSVPAPMAVTVALYDVLGRRVAALHDGPMGAGVHVLRFDGRGLPAGVYDVRAETEDGHAHSRRLTLVR